MQTRRAQADICSPLDAPVARRLFRSQRRDTEAKVAAPQLPKRLLAGLCCCIAA